MASDAPGALQPVGLDGISAALAANYSSVAQSVSSAASPVGPTSSLHAIERLYEAIGYMLLAFLAVLLICICITAVAAFLERDWLRPSAKADAGAGAPGDATPEVSDAPYRANSTSFGALRFVANTQVASGHFFQQELGLKFECGGASAVSLFLVMSGFVMTLAYGRKAEAAERYGPCSAVSRSFVARRVARLTPVYLLSVAVALVPGYLHTDYIVPMSRHVGIYSLSVVLTLLYLNGLLFPYPYASLVDGVFWNVSAMVFYYVCFIPLTRLLRLASPRSLGVFARDAGLAWLCHVLSFAAIAIPAYYLNFNPVNPASTQAESDHVGPKFWYRWAHEWGIIKVFAGILGSLFAAMALQLGEMRRDATALAAHAERWALVALFTLMFLLLFLVLGLVHPWVLPTTPMSVPPDPADLSVQFWAIRIFGDVSLPSVPSNAARPRPPRSHHPSSSLILSPRPSPPRPLPLAVGRAAVASPPHARPHTSPRLASG